eukprot:scaffold27961_cov33-Phaeocystis_antarctica.AAC.2
MSRSRLAPILASSSLISARPVEHAGVLGCQGAGLAVCSFQCAACRVQLAGCGLQGAACRVRQGAACR